MAVKLESRLYAIATDPPFLKISTPYNSIKIVLNYINKGLFYSPRIELQNGPLFIKYRAILVGIRGNIYYII